MASATLLQVTNMSPFATAQQMRELFSYLGVIRDLKVYPEDEFRFDVPSKVCFVDFEEAESVGVALHLTNTIFIDRALIVARSRYPTIPDEVTAMSMAAPAVATASRSAQPMGHTAPLLPTPPSVLGAPPTLPGQVPVQLPVVPVVLVQPQPTPPPVAAAAAAAAAAVAVQQPLISLMGTVVPAPPPLTGNVDPTKIEEIRRTVYVGNLNSTLNAEQVLTFFQPCGEIKFVRMAGDETQPTRFAFVEFSNPESVPIALQYNGAMFGDRPIKVNHSKNAIVKPQGPTAQEEKREVDEAMRKVKEAMAAITNAIDPAVAIVENKGREVPPPSRSKSPDRKRRRSRSPSHSRSHKRKSPSQSRSPRRRHRSRSRSPGRRRSHRDSYYGRHRSRSRSPRRRDRSRSPRRRDRSRSPRKRDKSRSRSPRKRDRSRSRSPKRSRHGRRRSKDKKSRSPERSSRKKKASSRSPSPSHDQSNGSSKKKSKKSKKHRRRRTPTPSPSPSPSPSPVPKVREEEEGGEGSEGGDHREEEEERASKSPGTVSGEGEESTTVEEGKTLCADPETDSSYE